MRNHETHPCEIAGRDYRFPLRWMGGIKLSSVEKTATKAIRRLTESDVAEVG